MLPDNWLLYGAFEIVAILTLATVLLLIYTRKLKGLTVRLQNKAKKMLQELKQERDHNLELKNAISDSYDSNLDSKLAETLDFHASQSPDCDISQDLSLESPMPRRVASLRHAMLMTEKEAYAEGNAHDSNWSVLQAKLGHIMTFLQQDAEEFFKKSLPHKSEPAQTDDQLEELKAQLATSHQHIDNLEHFREMFFNLEEHWATMEKELASCQQKMAEELAAANLEPNEHYRNALEQQQRIITAFGEQMQSPNRAADTGVTRVVDVDRKASADNSDELSQMKQLTANQHLLINELQQRLAHAYSSEEKQDVIDEMQQQLQKQLAFIQETESCIEQLENELQQANNHIDQMQTDMNSMTERQHRAAKLLRQAEQMQKRWDEMETSLKMLESENDQLASQLEASMANPGGDSSELEMQLHAMEEKYTQMETKYLELRAKNG